MPLRLKTLARAALAALGVLVYLWVAAVRLAPGVRARKAARKRLTRS